jgi:hypothetical protein
MIFPPYRGGNHVAQGVNPGRGAPRRLTSKRVALKPATPPDPHGKKTKVKSACPAPVVPAAPVGRSMLRPYENSTTQALSVMDLGGGRKSAGQMGLP